MFGDGAQQAGSAETEHSNPAPCKGRSGERERERDHNHTRSCLHEIARFHLAMREDLGDVTAGRAGPYLQTKTT